MKKYKLLKKFCDEQVEEVGTVFEVTTFIRYEVRHGFAINNQLVSPHEIPLLINAGYLQEVKEVNFEDARWKEGEIKNGDMYWFTYEAGINWHYWHGWDNDKYDNYYIKTNNCFKTEEAAQAYYESIVGKE